MNLVGLELRWDADKAREVARMMGSAIRAKALVPPSLWWVVDALYGAEAGEAGAKAGAEAFDAMNEVTGGWWGALLGAPRPPGPDPLDESSVMPQTPVATTDEAASIEALLRGEPAAVPAAPADQVQAFDIEALLRGAPGAIETTTPYETD